MEVVCLCMKVTELTSYNSNSPNPRNHMEYLVSIVSVINIIPLRLRLLFLPLREAKHIFFI